MELFLLDFSFLRITIVTLLSFIPVNNNIKLQLRSQKWRFLYFPMVCILILWFLQKMILCDWSKEIKFEHTKAKDSTAKYLAMGWGDRGFYLETPTWADLKVSTALKATTGLSSSALHTTFYKTMKEDAYCKKIQISTTEYQKLVVFINDSFETKSGKNIKIETDAVYGKNDIFYEAKGSYSLFYTCNSWANQALKSANQKAALHTLTDTGIFRHYSN